MYQTAMLLQLNRIKQLEDLLQQMQADVVHLKSDVMTSKLNEATSETEKYNQQAFVDPVLNLLKQPASDRVFVGPSAVISKVHAIRKILTNDQDLPKHEYYQFKHQPLEDANDLRPSKETEELYVECYLTFSRNRYHFIEKSDILKVFNKSVFERDKWEQFITFMVLANGCRMAELSKLSTRPSPKFYFDKAFEILSQLPILTPMQQIQVCMSLALYLHYSYDYLNPFVMNVWELSGMAIRKLIQLGYHKKKAPTFENCVQVELEKRLFWSVYAFDRLLSISLGRPSSISDSEIDTLFPLSLESVEDYGRQQILEWQFLQQNDPAFKLPVTSITYLEETCRIREIEARINIFAFGKQRLNNNEFDGINQALNTWISKIPLRKEFNAGLRNEVPFDYLILLYHRAKLFLLLPMITTVDEMSTEERQHLISQILTAAGGICRTFKKIQRESIFGYSTFSLHTIFLAGVTLVYCVWSMGRPSYIKTHNDIRACSNLLYSFSERANEADIYRVLFENLAENILYNVDVEIEKPQEFGLKDTELIQPDDLLEKGFNFTFDDDFWKRLDF